MYIQRKNPDSSPNATRLDRWIRGEGATFGIISLCALLGFLFFGALVLVVRNWGWWHIRDFERRRRYVKTWHGWVDKQKHEERLRRHQERRVDMRGTFRWKTTRANMAWMFWDPSSSKEQLYMKLRQSKMLNWLPSWMRSWPPGASKPDFPFDVPQGMQKTRADSRTQDLELGTVNHPSHRRRDDFQGGAVAQVDGPPSDIAQVDGPHSDTAQVDAPHSHINTVRSVRLRSEAIPNSSEAQNAASATVRRRRGDTIDSTAWHANSSETSRATVTQFFMPVHGFRTPVWAENLFGQHSPGKPNLKPSKHQSSATVTPIPSDQDQAPLPGRDTLRQERNAARRVIQSSPTPMQPLAASALHDFRSSTVLSTSIEFESLFAYIDRGSRYGRFGTTNPPRRLVDIDSVKRIDVPMQSQSLTQRPQKHRRPSIGNLFPSLRRHLSRAHKAPTAPQSAQDVQNPGSSLIFPSANPPEEYMHRASFNSPTPQTMNLQSPMVHPTASYDQQRSMQAVDRLNPVPTRWPDTLHPPKKRLSELAFSPSTPELQAVSRNSTTGIPSLSLQDPRPVSTISPSPGAKPSALAPSRNIPHEMNSRFDWLDVGSQYLSPSSAHRHGPQLSLDESILRQIEPSRALRRVGNLQNRNMGGGSGGSLSTEKGTERDLGVRSEGKENEQFLGERGGEME